MMAGAFELVFSMLIIVIGLFLIFGTRVGSVEGQIGNKVSSFNLFSGSEVASNSTSFEGGSVGAVFGGADIDLRHAGLAPDATILFGGLDVRH